MEKLAIPGISPYSGFSRSFQTFVQDIGAAKTKFEVDKIVKKKITTLRETISKPNLSAKQMKEHLIELVYCEMLGHDASFGHIHAVKFVEQRTMTDKRIGYAAACLLLNASDELTLLLVSTLQKDLKRSNILEVSFALMAVCRLVSREMIPAVVPVVMQLLDHKKEMIRKKAVMALLRFYNVDPSIVTDILPQLQMLLCDKDISVMATTLNFYEKLVKSSPADFKPLTSAFTKILDQISNGKVPNDFMYNNIPAPWVQIKLYKILALLGANDKRESEKMFAVLANSLQNIKEESSIGCAVAYECIITITSIYPMRTLIDLSEHHVGSFLMSPSNNIKYLGITAMTRLIRIDPSFAVKYQMTVIDCLSDPDETLKRKTLELLYKMTNASNVKVICDKLINYLRSSIDPFLREGLVTKLTDLAYRYSPDNEWFIDIMIDIFELGGNLVKDEVAHSIMQLLSEDDASDDCVESNASSLHKYAMRRYMALLGTRPLPDILTMTMVWVIGECAHRSESHNLEDVAQRLCSLLRDATHYNASTLPWIVSAIMKVISRLGSTPPEVTSTLLQLNNCSQDVDIKQRVTELLALNDFTVSELHCVLPVDGGHQDLEVDSSLSFLDAFVAADKSADSISFGPTRKITKMTPSPHATITSLKFEPYAVPATQESNSFRSASSNTLESSPGQRDHVTRTHALSTSEYVSEHNESGRTEQNAAVTSSHVSPVKQVWGPAGYLNFITMERPQMPTSTSENNSSAKCDFSPNASETNRSNEVEPQPLPQPTVNAEDERKRELASALFSGLDTTPSPKSRVDVKPESIAAESLPTLSSSLVNPEQSDTYDHTLTDGKPSDSLANSSSFSENLLSDSLSLDNRRNASDFKIEDKTAPSSTAQHASSSQLQDLLLLDAPQLDVKFSSNVQLDQIGEPPRPITSNLLDEDIPVDTSIDLTELHGLLPMSLHGYDCWERTEDVCTDQNIRLSLQLVYKPTETVVVMYIVNQCQHSLTDIAVVIRPPSNLKANLMGDNVEVLDQTASIIVLHPSQPRCIEMSLAFQTPSLNMLIDGQLNYKDQSYTLKRLFWNHQLDMKEFLRPSRIDIKEFEKLWPRHGCSEKSKFKLRLPSNVEITRSTIETKGQFHCVKVIGNEAIFAATILDGSLVLLHVKQHKSELDLWVKSTGQLLSRAVMDATKHILETLLA